MSLITVPPLRGDTSAIVLRVFGARPFQADGELLALAFNPDGSLWSVEEQGILRRWDIGTRQQTIWHLLDEPATLWAFGPGARRLVAGNDELSLWEVSTGKRLGTWPALSWTTAIAFSSSGNLLATGHDNTVIRLWNIVHGELIRELHGHDLAVSALAFSPDGKRLASAGEDKDIRIWDIASGEHIGSLIGHTDRIPALAWLPDGKRLVSAGWDTTARIWDVANLKPLILLNDHALQVYTLTISPDGNRLACADAADMVRIWDLTCNRTSVVLPAQSGEVRCLAFSSDGRHLAAGGCERVIHLWNADKKVGDYESGQIDSMASRTCVAISPDGNRVAGLGAGTGLRMWDTFVGQSAPYLADIGPLRAFAASPDGRWYAGSRAIGDGPEEWNARVLADSLEPRSTLCLWDARNGNQVATLEGQRAPITALAFDADSRTLASAGFLSSDVWLWHIPSGKPALLLPEVAEKYSVEALAFQQQGQLLAIAGIDWLTSGGNFGQVFLWDLDQREVVQTLPGRGIGLAFHPNGRCLAVGTLGQAIYIFDLRTGEMKRELIGHTDAVTCVAYSPGGCWVASGSDDRTVRLWDAETGSQCGVAVLDTQVKALTFTPDGRRLLTGNGSSSCYLLDMGHFLQK